MLGENTELLKDSKKDVDEKSEQFTSKVDPKYTFSEDEWLITVINTGSILGGHAAIVVEGIEPDPNSINKKKFIGQYDIAASAEADQDGSLNVNVKGYITKIKCFENDKCTRDYQQAKFPSHSFDKIPRLAVKRMISSIEKDELHTKNAMGNIEKQSRGEPLLLDENGKPYELFRFQRLGKDHPFVKTFGNTDLGHNCASWCNEKLEIAGCDRPGFKFSKPGKVSVSLK